MKTFAEKSKVAGSPARRVRKIPSTFDREEQIQRAQIREVLRAVRPQASFTIGKPNDKYEQEANRVAEQVMRIPEAFIQRNPIRPLKQDPSCGDKDREEYLNPTKPLAGQVSPLAQRQIEEKEEEEKLQAKPISDQITPLIQRQVDPEEEETIQTKQIPGQISGAAPDLESRIQALKGAVNPYLNLHGIFSNRVLVMTLPK